MSKAFVRVERVSAVHAVVTALACCVASPLGCEPDGRVRVTSVADGGAGSLRAAINAVNAMTAPAAMTRIELPTGTYDLTVCGGDDANGVGDLDLRANTAVTIVATGPNVVIRQRCAGERVLEQHGVGELTLNNVTVTGGALTSSSPEQPALGGGVRTRGDLLLVNATLRENSATAAAATAGLTGGAAFGGAAYVEGSLYTANAQLILNSATGGAGLASSAADVPGTNGGAAEGGAVFVRGVVSVLGGSIAQNRAVGGRGGDGTIPGDGGSVRGGAVAQLAASALGVRVERASFAGNAAEGGDSGYTPIDSPSSFTGRGLPGTAHGGALAVAGAIDATMLTVTQNVARGGSSGQGPTRRSALPGGIARGGAVYAGATAQFGSSVFVENLANGGSSVYECVWHNMCGGGAVQEAEGGGLYAVGAVGVVGGRFHANQVIRGAGYDALNGSDGRGGAIAARAAVTIEGGEYTGNRVPFSDGSAAGGAVSGGAVTVTGATFTENVSGGHGGAIDAASLVMRDVTATHNSANGLGGGAVAVSGDATIARSKVNQNRVNCSSPQPTLAGGGGISVLGRLTISDSEVSGNQGATYMQWVAGTHVMGSAYGPFQGGGIRAGSLQATAVSVTNNAAVGRTTTTPATAPGRSHPIPVGVSGGGGIASSTASLVNTTVAQNLLYSFEHLLLPADSGARAPAVLGTELTLDHATIADTWALASPILDVQRVRSMRSVVTARNSVCAPGVISDSGSAYNWFTDTSCALPQTTNQQRAQELFLGVLADNGGPGATLLPLPMSPLLDRVPATACPINTDARGTTRPQGSACDIGAVEAVTQPGTGPADIALAFVNPPAAVEPGSAAVWELSLRNNGPNATTPAVLIAAPAQVQVTALTAEGATCEVQTSPRCTWTAPLAPGATTTLRISATVNAPSGSALSWAAEVFVGQPIDPLTDDRATLTTPVRTASTVYFRAQAERDQGGGSNVRIDFINFGPEPLVGTEAEPIEVSFQTAPGVSASYESNPPTRLVGSFPAGANIANYYYRIQVSGPVPAILGTIAVRAPASPHALPPPVSIPAADVELTASRVTSSQPNQTEFELRLTNKGPGTAENVSFWLGETNYWVGSPTAGLVSYGVWWIPSFAPGQTATLRGVAVDPRPDERLRAHWNYRALPPAPDTYINTLDLNRENDSIDMDLGLASGTNADLEVRSVAVSQGSSPMRRLIRAVVANRGPSSAAGPIVLSYDHNQGMASARALSSGWTCSPSPFGDICTSANSLRSGATVTFEIEIELHPAYTTSDPRPMIAIDSATLDLNPTNNRRWFDLIQLAP